MLSFVCRLSSQNIPQGRSLLPRLGCPKRPQCKLKYPGRRVVSGGYRNWGKRGSDPGPVQESHVSRLRVRRLNWAPGPFLLCAWPLSIEVLSHCPRSFGLSFWLYCCAPAAPPGLPLLVIYRPLTASFSTERSAGKTEGPSDLD